MLVYLADYLSQIYSFFNVFQYITLRTILSILTSLIITIFFGPFVIDLLTKTKVGQNIRNDGPKSHLSKAGTPTMGGLLILFAIVVSTILWSDLNNRFVWFLLFALTFFGLIGFYDDFAKLRKGDSKGLSAKGKLFLQSLGAILIASLMYIFASSPAETSLIVPFFKDININLGLFFLVSCYFVIVGTSNAVNLSDGLDGLAIVPVVMIGGAMIILAYLAGNINFANYLSVPYIRGVGEVCVFAGALVGAGLGFLWFNSYPAEIFMGDVGSLSLGAALGTMAILVRQELLLVVMGGIFVLETVSVILQVLSFKLTGRRIFKMAPIHHHFELKGWVEPKVIVRFWIITAVLVLVALATLKVR